MKKHGQSEFGARILTDRGGGLSAGHSKVPAQRGLFCTFTRPHALGTRAHIIQTRTNMARARSEGEARESPPERHSCCGRHPADLIWGQVLSEALSCTRDPRYYDARYPLITAIRFSYKMATVHARAGSSIQFDRNWSQYFHILILSKVLCHTNS